ncbi:uncharacterized protein Eint_111700 [Encephalitozoon intestinalis ATCC 50506]|uniref:Uncharacterized protein n=1 Tax=Encephalitozoon intestinalis (strain ATCC 50506) TaxID=876142 RepID=E0SA47_ENCIT|nr:uncharacterized protein Eint_111700 [Encephalitozoon intestinalis ATCC 50506]ADM12669.1 hypothetical protein Eint_111700 [Encephalitozoon intestinalis ATCC 50506]UTX46530.1 hypothetical protein GPK93_11g21420 [Encephalitozoon intestinalis]
MNPAKLLRTDCPALYAAFVVSPIVGYVPQILARDILLSPLISTFFIMTNILKIFHYSFERYSQFLLAQYVFTIILHVFLIAINKRPLSTYEAKILGNRTMRVIYRRYGPKGSVLGIICVFVFSINLYGTLYGSYEHCGRFSSVLEIAVNLFQLVLEREEKTFESPKKETKRSPKEVYFCWIIGDVIKIWLMSSIKAPIVFVGTIAIQIFINLFLILS